MVDRFNALLDDAEDDKNVRVVVLSGEGPVFTAGHDLNEVKFETDSTGPGGPQSQPYMRTLPRAWFFSKGLIAAVHGYVGPMGSILLAPFDFIIAADTVRFNLVISQVGSSLPSHSDLLAFQVPMRVMLKMRMMGGFIDASTAAQLHLVQRVVPETELLAETMRWADELSKVPTEQVRAAKTTTHRVYELMGLAAVMTAGSQVSGHSGEDKEFWDRVAEIGVRQAAAERQAGRDMGIAKV
jgi:enoyl-CoA hydratase/carnithine racemase